MGLATPETIGKLQAALHAKAKRAPDFRFYSLYDKIHRKDVLSFAYRLAKSSRGVPGVDGQTFGKIESYGVERWLGELAERYRLRRWLRKKHKVRTSVYRRWPAVFFEQVGLVSLVERRRGLSCANA